MNLTRPQQIELKACAREPQRTYGSARVRVQNRLVKLGLAIYIYPRNPNDTVDELCKITNAGLAVLANQPHLKGRS